MMSGDATGSPRESGAATPEAALPFGAAHAASEVEGADFPQLQAIEMRGIDPPDLLSRLQ